MLENIKKIYDFAEETYLDFEDMLLDTTLDTYDLAKEYMQTSSDKISNYINTFFTEKDNDTIDNPVLSQLNKIDKVISSLKFDSNDDWDSKLIYSATSLGHLNEKIVKLLCNHYHTNYGTTQASKIKSLDQYLPRIIISDFYFINTYRNSIIHANDFQYSLTNLNKTIKSKLFYETKAAIAKMRFIFVKLEEIKAK